MSAEDLIKSFQSFVLEKDVTKTNIREAWKLYARYVAQTGFMSGEGLIPGTTNLLGVLEYGDGIDRNTVRPLIQRFHDDTFPFGNSEQGLLIRDLPIDKVNLAFAFCIAMVKTVEEKYKPISE